MRCALLGAIMLSLTASPPGTTPQQTDERPLTRSLTVEQKAVYDVIPPRPRPGSSGGDGLEVLAWVDRPDYTYASGEDVQVFVETNKDAYVTLLNVDPAGRTTVLFPNDHQRDNFVAANRTLRVPAPAAGFRIVVGGEVGTELLKVIASTERRSLFEAGDLSGAGPFQMVRAQPARLARSLTVVMADSPSGAVGGSAASAAVPSSSAGAGSVAGSRLVSASNEWAMCHQAITTVPTLSAATRRTRSLTVQRTEARDPSIACEEAR